MPTISRELQRARAYAQSTGAHVQGGDRAAFHVCAPVGWINDPNGFSLYGGKIHLFFQHHPYDWHWGPMHWGHVTTEDFVRWQLLPEALAPDRAYESGCFSGSAVTWRGRHALIYTSHLDRPGPDGIRQILEQQSLALGDGVDYEKVPEDPILRTEALPEGACARDFRDPRVWEEDGRYRMIVASRRADGLGSYLIYESEDLRGWRFVTELLHSDGHRLGKMWECPDWFPLDGSRVLLLSAQEMEADDEGFHGLNGTAALVGGWEKATETFTPGPPRPIDYGWDFYAPQTVLTADGRRVMIAWMQSWDDDVTPPEQRWAGMMTFPRELRVRGGRLYQAPVRELERYHADSVTVRSVAEKEGRRLTSGRQLDFTLTVEDAAAAVFSLDVAAGGAYRTRLTYDAPAGRLTVDRTHAGMPGDRYPVQIVPLVSVPERAELRAVMDRGSLELFLNGGEQAVSVLIWTDPACGDVILSADAPLRYTFVCHRIEVGEDA